MMSEAGRQTIGQFQIVHELGRGGMAVVYKAYQPALQRYVALKVLPPHFSHDEGFVKRFRQEAIAAARLRHPHIVTIHDVGQEGNVNFIVMELLEGQPLSQLIQPSPLDGAPASGAPASGVPAAGAPMPPERVVKLMTQIASALDYAHQQGFVHRDIKPSNIMVSSDDHATLTDFGIARARGAARLTQTGAVIGTPEYMSPEQVRGDVVDHRADIYALGIVCYEMLAGRAPFSGDTATLLYKQAHETPPPLTQWVSGTPEAIGQAVSRALAKNPVERFQSAGEFAGALAHALVSSTRSDLPLRLGASTEPERPTWPDFLAHPQAATQPRPPAQPVASQAQWPGWLKGLIATAGLLGCLALILVGVMLARGPRGQALPTLVQVVISPTSTPAGGQGAASTATLTPTPQPITATPTPPASATATLAATATPSDIPTLPPTDTPLPPPSDTPTPACPAVDGPFADIWQSAQDRLGCASGQASTLWVAEERFESGVMYWRQDREKEVLVIYGLDAPGQRWETYQGDWAEGDPEFTCGVETSPPTPKRGFGRAWCTYPEIREGLGNAVNTEAGFNGLLQDFQRGMLLRLDDGSTYVLYAGDGWDKR